MKNHEEAEKQNEKPDQKAAPFLPQDRRRSRAKRTFGRDHFGRFGHFCRHEHGLLGRSRQTDGYLAAGLWLIADGDGSSVRRDNRLHYRQSRSGAFDVA